MEDYDVVINSAG